MGSTLDTAAVDADHFALKVYHGVTDAPRLTFMQTEVY
ncbi:hypothetical protein Ct9H90mP29_16520 [bacterium]|nr:MAG: hypothetical protein Ct9H90mP29_16520 [bacterium]